MSQASVADVPGTKVKIPTWQITKRQWIAAVIVFIAILVVFISYESLNYGPPASRWPSYFAYDDSTHQLVQPLTGDDPYQTFVLKSWLDAKLPFVPILALPYLSFLVIVPIVVPLLTLALSSFRRFLTIGIALIVSQLLLDVAYVLFQTNVIRDVKPPDGILGELVKLVWGNDQPFNGYPSGHTTWTTIGIIGLFRLRKVIPKTAWILMPWLALVYPATVMLRQHYLMDVYAGLFVGFATYWGVMFLIERPRLVPREPDPLDRALAGNQ